MKTDESQIAIVTESYDQGENQVVVARDPDIVMHHFFFLPQHPAVNFGDTLIMKLHTDKYWIHHGNPRLSYRIFPLPFPGTLLWELIQTQMNEDSK